MGSILSRPQCVKSTSDALAHLSETERVFPHKNNNVNTYNIESIHQHATINLLSQLAGALPSGYRWGYWNMNAMKKRSLLTEQ